MNQGDGLSLFEKKRELYGKLGLQFWARVVKLLLKVGIVSVLRHEALGPSIARWLKNMDIHHHLEMERAVRYLSSLTISIFIQDFRKQCKDNSNKMKSEY